ncbi:MAG: hypothetical protein CM15mP12_7890 [Gammaproteobacteria bacterium]|nr:MAG: hypothetical protein CM15mP12_7890 [Gammaproteobacteria bacterium]
MEDLEEEKEMNKKFGAAEGFFYLQKGVKIYLLWGGLNEKIF